jgi:hypothetical protein
VKCTRRRIGHAGEGRAELGRCPELFIGALLPDLAALGDFLSQTISGIETETFSYRHADCIHGFGLNSFPTGSDALDERCVSLVVTVSEWSEFGGSRIGSRRLNFAPKFKGNDEFQQPEQRRPSPVPPRNSGTPQPLASSSIKVRPETGGGVVQPTTVLRRAVSLSGVLLQRLRLRLSYTTQDWQGGGSVQ